MKPSEKRKESTAPGPASIAFGSMIREGRNRLNMSAGQLLSAMVDRDCLISLNSKSAVSAWEYGTQFPRRHSIYPIADILQINFDELKAAYNAAANERGRFAITAPSSWHERKPRPVIGAEDMRTVANVLESIGSLPLETVIQLLVTRLENKSKEISGKGEDADA